MVRIRVLKIKHDYIDIAGMLPLIPAGKYRKMMISCNNGTIIDPELFPMPYKDKKDDSGNVVSSAWGFRAKLPLRAGAQYRFSIDKSKTSKKLMGIKQELRFGAHSMLQNTENAYVDTGEFIIRYIDDEISVTKADLKTRLLCRYKLNRTLKNEGREDLIQLRRYARSCRGKGKPVVIISDRVNKAGDNGEALFKYLIANGYDAEFDICFAVSKESPDYERLGKIGPVLDFGSFEYRRKFLIADKIITSGFDRWFSNAFGSDYQYLADLYRFDHCFLQHGVIMNDLSRALNYTAKGFSLFCTSARGEYLSILDDCYGYHEDEVILTGLARYDYLEDEAEKLIVIAPTWRYNLASDADEKSGTRHYSDLVAGSDYCNFYNSLINDRVLTDCMRENGYRGEFYLHPGLSENISDFKGNGTIKVCEDADYNRIFRKAAILVTDYSSINMDFAYLGKPVVYSQFDQKEFFDKHLCRSGYFDYARDGFGPVCTSLNETVSEIVELIRSGCKNAPVYAERSNSFFMYRDKNNCARIADAVFGKRKQFENN